MKHEVDKLKEVSNLLIFASGLFLILIKVFPYDTSSELHPYLLGGLFSQILLRIYTHMIFKVSEVEYK